MATYVTSAWLQAMCDDAPIGGVIDIPGGTHTLSAGVVVTANKRIHIRGHGSVFRLAAGVTGFKINQGISQARGVRLEGITIDGQGDSGTVGVEFEDTNNAELIDCQIENCGTAVLLDSRTTNKFVEGSVIEDCVLRDNLVGIDFTIGSGTGSFAQTVIRGLKCVVGGTGLRLNQNAILQRSFVQGTFWIGTDETAVNLDGNIEDATLNLAIEGEGAATGNTGLVMGSNATNTEQAFITLLFTGTIATQVSNTGSKNFHYWSGGSQIVQSTGNAVLGYKRHGDATDRLRFEGLTAGGRIQFGTGSALDSAIFRSAAAILGVTSTFEFTEIADPAAGSTNTARLYAKDNGAGKTQLVVRFPTGAVQVIATEP